MRARHTFTRFRRRGPSYAKPAAALSGSDG